MKPQRKARLFTAVLHRISEQGDMNIRVRSETFYAIIRANGFKWDTIDREGYREVDAVALQALILKADWE